MNKFPTGFAAVQVMECIREKNIELSNKVLEESYKEELKLYGTSISALYHIATCAYGCRGGDHTFEYLAGRAFNLAGSAFTLIQQCYYDEALNQIRSLGELANLQSLFWSKPEEFYQWRIASEKKRKDNFSAFHVRTKIEACRGLLIMDKDEYQELCELATHFTPETQPNMHNSAKQPTVGGIFQENGIAIAIDKLVKMTSAIALGFSRMLNHNELFEQLVQCVNIMKDNALFS